VQTPPATASVQTPPAAASVQTLPAAAMAQTCAALLAETTAPAVDATTTEPARDTSVPRRDTASVSVGGAQTGDPDIILTAAVQANEVRFASQPRVRVRLCWGGDTLRVVQRQNIPSPVVAGTTYRNVYVAVELLGRLNAECLVERISSTRTPVARATPDSAAGFGACAFLGAAAATGSQPSRPPP
ncbi:MAG TPA: hypothetical protein VJZ25_02105, partial [Gemmatimonadaceae bacterium]|nr:hypothetical protein [Gemmatimonadaceae bacterium]